MPYVLRNWKGEITGYSEGGPMGDKSELVAEDHPDLVAYIKAHPIPPEMLRPLTEQERAEAQADWERVRKEHDEIQQAIWRFNGLFSQLETALSCLLYAAIHQPKTQIAYAIYFSPNGFDARREIVDNAVQQIVSENERLKPLLPLWAIINDKTTGPRNTRNKIAHGMPGTLIIRNKKHVRLTSPSFDQIRIGRPVRAGRIPGLTASDINAASDRLIWLRERIDEVNRLLFTHFEDGNPTLPEKFAELEAGLKKPDSP
jgi:hypothetical protein